MKHKIKKMGSNIAKIQLDGIGVIEIILILVIIIGLVLIFRQQIGDIIAAAFESIKADTAGISEKVVID
ncbi:hypothetical protein HNQ56_000063 [Anaerotaenia torta]|uniref:Flp1 family type IVb pilin n=1 Tax=Anaerotaenia torta TaxID=433293 RepID=UPI003D20317A